MFGAALVERACDCLNCAVARRPGGRWAVRDVPFVKFVDIALLFGGLTTDIHLPGDTC